MNRFVELPLIEPMYSTYHYQGPGVAIAASNPSIRFWYLSEVMNLTCTRRFLHGYTTPEIGIQNSTCGTNPYLEKKWYMLEYLKGYSNIIIRDMLDHGFYVYFNGVDDYYVEGKSWYREKHFNHDGLICGYNRDDKTYCLYAYDKNWVYRKFWTPQSGFDKGRTALFKAGIYGAICGYKPKPDIVTFSATTARAKLEEYLDSDFEKYPQTEDGMVYGTVVHDYIALYLGRLYDGSVPYERMDRRIFRLIWEHKKVMHERLRLMEKAFCTDGECSSRYARIVSAADAQRMMYAAHVMRQRNALLPTLARQLLAMSEEEKIILREMLTKTKGKQENETLA